MKTKAPNEMEYFFNFIIVDKKASTGSPHLQRSASRQHPRLPPHGAPKLSVLPTQGKLSSIKNDKKGDNCPLWTTPPLKWLKSGHLLSCYWRKCINGNCNILILKLELYWAKHILNLFDYWNPSLRQGKSDNTGVEDILISRGYPTVDNPQSTHKKVSFNPVSKVQ